MGSEGAGGDCGSRGCTSVWQEAGSPLRNLSRSLCLLARLGLGMKRVQSSGDQCRCDKQVCVLVEQFLGVALC